jgi:DNA-binding Xre family transcriptional regulator
MKNKDIPIGNLIQKRLKNIGHTVPWLADKMYYTRTSIYKIFKSQTIDTGALMRFCKVLKFNFFTYYYDCYKKFDTVEENMKENKDKKEEEIHIGLKIHKTIKESMRTIKWLANEMGYTERGIYKIFNQKTIDTDKLKRFCIILKFNFFIYYYNCCKKFDETEK